MSELLTDNGKKDGQTKEQPAPSKLTLRSYQVGFGDCYMLSFHYTDKQRHVLIDFGSTGRPKNADKDLMMNVARQVHAHCKGELDVLVATHRHQDHISGFATSHSAGKQDTGDIIRSCFARFHRKMAAVVAGLADLRRRAEQRPRLANIAVALAKVNTVSLKCQSDIHPVVDDQLYVTRAGDL